MSSPWGFRQHDQEWRKLITVLPGFSVTCTFVLSLNKQNTSVPSLRGVLRGRREIWEVRFTECLPTNHAPRSSLLCLLLGTLTSLRALSPNPHFITLPSTGPCGLSGLGESIPHFPILSDLLTATSSCPPCNASLGSVVSI